MRRYTGVKTKKPSKYGNKKTEVDGIIFDSQAEARRYCELRLLERSRAITGLQMQVAYDLAPSIVIQGRKRPPLRYNADFVYEKDGELIVEDVKGKPTEGYRIKRHLMMSVHNIEIREVRYGTKGREKV